MNLAFERDCKSYPEYTHCESSSSVYGYADYAYETARITPRVPQMGISAGGHRRTLSGISSSSSNAIPAFCLENEDNAAIAYQFNNLNLQTQSLSPQPSQNITTTTNVGGNRMRIYENLPLSNQPIVVQKNPYYPAANNMPLIGYTHHQPFSMEYNQSERPITLAFEHGGQTKLRSSLKKHNSQRQGNSDGGTPTNPTPPDSLTSDDSSYLSAKEGSVSSQSRVRFSPETLLDLPAQGQCLDATVPIQAVAPLNRRRSLSRTRYQPDDTMS